MKKESGAADIMQGMPQGIAVCQWCIPCQGPQALGLAAEMGYDGVEMDMGVNSSEWNLLRDGVLECFLREKRNAGIETPTLAFNGFCMNRKEDKKEKEAFLQRAMEAAARLSVSTLQMPSFWNEGMRTEEEFAATAETLRFACREAAKYGIRVGSENLLDLPQSLRLIREVGEENFGIYFDTANPYLFADMDGMEMLEALYPHICEVHVKDYMLDGTQRCMPLGAGECRAKEALAFLGGHGYGKWIVVENELSREKLAQDAKWLRRMCGMV